MKIGVFTSNQPRHLALIERLAAVANEVVAVQECNTVFPGRIADFFKKSDVMQAYFARVMAAEDAVFGGVRFLPANVRTLSLKSGDINHLDVATLAPVLACDILVVFGASYIKGPLIDALIERRAVNIHMGVSPYYRGAACNFWAVYDSNPDLVGATIHLLTRGLNTGPMLYHVLPRPEALDPFVLTMRAVKVAHESVAGNIASGRLGSFQPQPQDKTLELRYTRTADFTDEVAREFLARQVGAAEIGAMLRVKQRRVLVSPDYG